MAQPVVSVDALGKRSPRADAETDSQESMTPTTTAGSETESEASTLEAVQAAGEKTPAAPQLGPGLYHDDIKEEDITSGPRHTEPPACEPQPGHAASAPCLASAGSASFKKELTLFVFDWDDTILPSSWIRRQGLRLDESSCVNAWQRQKFAEVSDVVIQTLQLARRHGTVVLVTSAERGWIELSCRKFLPAVMPILENFRMVSARTSYEGPRAPSPLDWKMRAFEVELARFYGCGGLQDVRKRKNVFSLGDGAHEREALLRNTAGARNCRAKSLKFEEHPDLEQIVKQHMLIIGCFDQLVNSDADYDLCISCP